MVTEVNHPLNHSHPEGTIYLHKLWGIMPGEGEGEGGGGGKREREKQATIIIGTTPNNYYTVYTIHC